MTGLRAAARRMADRPLGFQTRIETVDASDAAARVDAHGPGLHSRPTRALDPTAGRIAADLEAGRTLSRADLRDAAWCLWSTKPAIGLDERLFSNYLRAVIRMDRLTPYRALASSYVVEFRRDRSAFQLVARALALNATRAGLPWSALQETLGLFDPETVIRRVLDRAFQRNERPSQVIEALRIGRIPKGAGLITAIHAAGLDRLKAAGNDDPIGRLASVSIWATGSDGRLIAPELAPAITDALLAPFRGETPDQAVRDRYLTFILTLLGDPRTAQEWIGRSVKNEAIVRRWLTEQTLRMFVEVVAKSAPPEEWAHRRAFWESLYRASMVDDAWVVFDREGASTALRAFGETASFARFPTLADVPRGAAILMLRIGPFVLIDWSHGGPCCIWDTRTDTAAPQMFLQSYEPQKFRKPTTGPDTWEGHAAEGIFWHSGIADYVWQDSIAAWLKSASSGRLTPAAYRI